MEEDFWEPLLLGAQVSRRGLMCLWIMENIGTHTLRKTFGYYAYQSGVAIEVIQKLFNHSTPATTLRYIGITQEHLDEVYLNL